MPATSLDAFSPAESCQSFVRSGIDKKRQRWDVQFGKGVMAGFMLGLGALLSLIAGGGLTTISTQNPSLVKLISAAVFPIGLIALVLCGADLVTGSMFTLTMAAMKRKVPLWFLPANWLVVFLGNVCGSLIAAGLLGKASDIFAADPYKAYAIKFAVTKAVTPNWGAILVRGIGCNFLVTLAVYLSSQSRDLIGKVAVLYFPIFTFVALGFDHVVANATFIPLGIMLGEAAPLTTGYYIWKSLIPSFIGNVIGAWFLAMPLTYFYLSMQGAPDSGEAPSDLEAGEKRGAIPQGTTERPFKTKGEQDSNVTLHEASDSR